MAQCTPTEAWDRRMPSRAHINTAPSLMVPNEEVRLRTGASRRVQSLITKPARLAMMEQQNSFDVCNSASLSITL